jgi:transcriptional regulator with XRE-family HTH domain
MADWRQLTERRKALGFNQEQLAAALEVDRTTVGRWERGETEPRPYLRPKLARLLRISPSELGSLLDASARIRPAETEAGAPATGQLPGSGSLDDMIRREFLRLVSVTGALVTVPTAEIGRAAEPVAAEDLAERAALNSHLWSVYGLTSAKQSVYPMAREQVAALTAALRSRRSAKDHRALCSLIADMAQLMGEVWFDANRYTEAAHCYALAADAGKEAGDRDLWACALVRHSFVSLYGRRYDEAVPLLHAARVLAHNGDRQLPTRHWVASVEAQALAGTGDVDGCKRALDEAAGVRALSAPAPGGWLRFTGDRLAEDRGSAFVALGRLDLAESALGDALQEQLSPRRRGSVLADLATIGARRSDVDQLVSYGTTAVELAHRTGSGYVARRLEGLQPHLGRFLSDHRVRELADRIRALGVLA